MLTRRGRGVLSNLGSGRKWLIGSAVAAGIVAIASLTTMLRAQPTHVQTDEEILAARLEALAQPYPQLGVSNTVPLGNAFFSAQHPEWPPVPGNWLEDLNFLTNDLWQVLWA